MMMDWPIEFCEVGMFMLRLFTTKKYSGQIVYKCNVKAGNLNKLFWFHKT